MATVPGNLFQVRSENVVWIYIPTEGLMIRAEEISEGQFVILASRLESYVKLSSGLIKAEVWLRDFCRYICPVEVPEEAVVAALEAVSQQLSLMDAAVADFTADPEYTKAARAIHTLIVEKGP